MAALRGPLLQFHLPGIETRLTVVLKAWYYIVTVFSIRAYPGAVLCVMLLSLSKMMCCRTRTDILKTLLASDFVEQNFILEQLN